MIRALRVTPEELAARAVEADALLERGSFLGEVMALQLELHRLGNDGDPARRMQLATESRRLLGRNHDAIFGELAPHALSVVPKSLDEPTGHFAACTASWRLGAIDEVALSASPKLGLAEVVPKLAKVPAARNLRSIVCGSSAPPSARWSPVSYEQFLETLVDHAPAFPEVRALFLGALGDERVAEEAGDLEPVYRAFPRLEVLRVRAHRVELGSFELPELREVELAGECASLEALERLHDARPRELVALTVEQGSPRSSLAQALAIVGQLPRLERLALRGWFGDQRVASLLALPWLDRLEELDLSRNGLVREIAALVDAAPRLSHLHKLDLRFNGFASDPERLHTLRSRLPQADLAGQSTEPDTTDRYDDIEE